MLKIFLAIDVKAMGLKSFNSESLNAAISLVVFHVFWY